MRPFSSAKKLVHYRVMKPLEAVIGLEVHVQLKTKSKMFCRCDNRDDQPPNTAICPICTGQPGALPLANAQAIDWAIMASLALGCTINQESKFDRKHYFYPDLPKGYQISQYDKPFGVGGQVTVGVDGQSKTFRIHRLHLEEDAGKLIHQGQMSLVDLNRAGTPLMEIVSEPDFRTPAEAKAYMQELRLIMRYLGVSDADMEKGHLRCDANISLRPVGSDELFPKTEIKNLNSFKAVERALAFEIARQRGLWDDGQPPKEQSTRGWDEAAQKTVEQRTKEEAADYRYFPEPDIPPIVTSDEHLAELKAAVPELPQARRERFVTQLGITGGQAENLVEDRELAEYFEQVISEFDERAGDGADHAFVANWLLNKISAKHRSTRGLSVAPAAVAEILDLLRQGKINAPGAATLFEQVRQTKKSPEALLTELGLEQVSDADELEKIVADVIAANAKVVAEVKTGKAAGVQFLVGQVMKATKGKANPQVVQELLKKTLS